MFNLSAPDVANRVATALLADKLLLLDGERISQGLWGRARDRIPRQITLSQAEALLADDAAVKEHRGLYRRLKRAVQVCRSGVRRVHLMDYRIDGGLLLEIYTRDGIGTMVCSDTYDTMRKALVDDIAGIIKLIAPLEEQGILVRRSREKLEAEIDHFLIMERDGAIIACAAAYPCVDAEQNSEGPIALAHRQNETGMIELACLAVHQDYRNTARGNALLAAIEKETHDRGATHLFVLTTHTEHWFLEHGFSRATLNDLPQTRRRMYNESRNAKVLVKAL